MSSDLNAFDLGEMLRCGSGVRKAAAGSPTCEEAAQRIARFLYDELRDAGTGERQCVMVRVYVTHPYATLDASLRAFADRQLAGVPAAATLRCLCLLATVGQEPTWNDRRQSSGHQAIPLATREMIEQAPMIAQLVRQLGLDFAELVTPAATVLPELLGRTYGVFHVEHALGSPFIPAQADFVERYGVRSVVGFGGALRSSDMFSVILFTRVTVGRATADRFRNIALDAKSMLFAYPDDRTFVAGNAPPR